MAVDGFDIDGLGAVLRALLQAEDLFEQDHRDLIRDGNASGEVQLMAYNMTCGGTAQLAGNARRSAGRLAQALGFAAVGLEDRAQAQLRMARSHPVGEGLDRLARPLLPRTIQGLTVLSEVSGFFDPWHGKDAKTVIEAALCAPAATWPPADWGAYQREQQRQKETGIWPDTDALTRAATSSEHIKTL